MKEITCRNLGKAFSALTFLFTLCVKTKSKARPAGKTGKWQFSHETAAPPTSARGILHLTSSEIRTIRTSNIIESKSQRGIPGIRETVVAPCRLHDVIN